jgi:hypothetical protein
MDNYVLWVVRAIILIVAVIFLIKKPLKEKELIGYES